jgi:DNA-binding MarR family transcriptional regulator
VVTRALARPVARWQKGRAIMGHNEAPPDARFGKTLQFMQQLWELSHALQSLSKRMESSLGVTGPQRLALRIIGRQPGISAGELSSTLRIHPSTLTGILRRLEERRAIRREADPDDARRARLHLAASGRDFDRERSPTVEAAVRRAMLHCSASDLAAAKRVLRTMITEIEREASDD